MIKSNFYDFVIIGSGFGGSVSALRLSEKGYSVLVIEKGKRAEEKDFPQTNWNLRKWLWVPQLKWFGIQKFTFLRHASILSGVGVGGGSLVYANTLARPKPEFFRKGSWAQLSNWETELDPWYTEALNMLGAATNPFLADSDLALETLAKQKGKGESFSATQVGVYFGEPDVEVPDPYFGGRGPARKGCTHCGSCMTGCRHNAKNTLDKNYLYLAQLQGAEILPEHKVVSVKPVNEKGDEGYHILFRQSTRSFAPLKSVQSKAVIFAGGVLGTVPLLHKLKNSTLPDLSPRIGDMVRTNNETLIICTSVDPELELYKGVAIGSIMEADGNSHLEPVRYGKGSGFWRIAMLPMVSKRNPVIRILQLLVTPFKSPLTWLKVFFVRDFGKSSTVLLFMQHLDSTLKLKTGRFGLKTRIQKGLAPTPFIPEAHQLAREYSEIIKGKPQIMVNEVLAGIPSTAHILGGACMGETSENGVIDDHNRLFGYQNLYVFDGSMISANPGVNPSLTISAITERGMSKIPKKSST